MFTTNPFLLLTDFIPSAVLQGHIVLMVLAAAIGPVLDLLHGKKIRSFLQARQLTRTATSKTLGTADVAAICVKVCSQQAIDVRDHADFAPRGHNAPGHCRGDFTCFRLV
jgi:hypothetical protein